jgi:hypothetical protein
MITRTADMTQQKSLQNLYMQNVKLYFNFHDIITCNNINFIKHTDYNNNHDTS